LHGQNNKILWGVQDSAGGAGSADHQGYARGRHAHGAVSVPGGPGPSIIDLPAPGCWTFHLSWSGHTDELQLRYVA
jgi:hypothetical protein